MDSPLLRRLGLVTDADFAPDKRYPNGGEYVTSRRRNTHNVKVFQKRKVGKTDNVGGLTVQAHWD